MTKADTQKKAQGSRPQDNGANGAHDTTKEQKEGRTFDEHEDNERQSSADRSTNGQTDGGGHEVDRSGEPQWFRESSDAVFERLGTSRAGLSDDEASSRLDKYGRNTIGHSEEVRWHKVLLNQFKSPLIYVLIAALVVTLLVQSWTDAIVIAIVLLINGTIGFLQEYRAENAVNALMKMVSPKARVRRDGGEREIEGSQLVPGDILLLEQGDMVAADVRLVEVHSLQVNEAALTGESVPVLKHSEAQEDAGSNTPPADQENMAFMSTAVTSGNALGVVVATAEETQFGKIAEQMRAAGKTETPLQERIGGLARWIAAIVLVISVVSFIGGWLLGRNLDEMLLLAVALAVGAVPEGLPIVVTVALAVGVRRMARRNVAIRKLHAVDTLGSCTAIVSDKTGTLTQNRMTVRTISAGGELFDVEANSKSEGGSIRRRERADEGDNGPADGQKDESPPRAQRQVALDETLLVGVLCNEASLASEAANTSVAGDRNAGTDTSVKGKSRDDSPTDNNISRKGKSDEEDDEDRRAKGDPMEIALLYAGLAAGISRAKLQNALPLREIVPFRTEERYMASIHDVSDAQKQSTDGSAESGTNDGEIAGGDTQTDPDNTQNSGTKQEQQPEELRLTVVREGQGPLVLVKGAPERILSMCDRARTNDGDTAELDRDAIVAQSEELAAEGLRMLAMAVGRGEEIAEAVRGSDPQGLIFAGLQGMFDPPRESAVEAVDNCHRAGIRVLMVTGDHASTAAAIAQQVHIDQPVQAERGDRDRQGRTGRRGFRRGDSVRPTEVHVTYDAYGLPDDVVDQTTRRLSVDTHVPDGHDVRVSVKILGNRDETSGTGERERGEGGRQTDASEPGGGKRSGGRPEPEQDSPPEVIAGKILPELSDEKFREAVRRVNVFARVTPDQKTRIVNQLKEHNEIVAVTGDGVNDAPALKSAHLGAAMGSGTDVAKEASDMVITDDNFASVYAAVEEGRTAFRNIRMATFFLLSTGAATVAIILIALGLGWPLPLLPAQILWCNVVTNGIADVALAFEPGEKSLFRRPPRPKHEGVLDRTLIERLVVIGVWLSIGTLGVFFWAMKYTDGGIEHARTAALTTLILFQMVHVFNCRSEDVSFFKKSLISNRVLFIGVPASLAVHLVAIYLPFMQDLLSLTPLTLTSWTVATGVALTAIAVNELHKWLRPRYS